MDQQTRHYYLQNLGIPVWIPKDAAEAESNTSVSISANAPVSIVEQSLQTPVEIATKPPVEKSTENTDGADYIDSAKLAALKPKQTETTKAAPVNASNLLSADWNELRSSFAELCGNNPQAVMGRGSLRAPILVMSAESLADDSGERQSYQTLLNNMLRAMRVDADRCYFDEVMRQNISEPEQQKAQRAIAMRQASLLTVKTVVVVGDCDIADAVLQAKPGIETYRIPSPQAILDGKLSKAEAWSQMAPQLNKQN